LVSGKSAEISNEQTLKLKSA